MLGRVGVGEEAGAREDLLHVRLVRQVARRLLEDDEAERKALPHGPRHLELVDEPVGAAEGRDVLEACPALGLVRDGVEAVAERLRRLGRAHGRGEHARASEELDARAELLRLLQGAVAIRRIWQAAGCGLFKYS